jgi:hypothetical protein
VSQQGTILVGVGRQRERCFGSSPCMRGGVWRMTWSNAKAAATQRREEGGDPWEG